MANITELLQKILNARYGKDVRGSIHDAIQAMNQEIEDDRPTVINSMERAETAAETAEKCASDSERSKETADGSAKMAKSYTHGGTGLRENEDTDNAKYYKEQVENKALIIEGYSQTASDAAQTATEAANRAEQSVSSIGTSVEAAQAAATSAIESASSASNDAQNALQCASAALESAESSSQSASEAQASAEAAARSAEEAKAVANVNIATTEKAGIVKPDGTTITVDEDGTLHGSSSVDEMTGATADKDGTSGTVPAPTAGDRDKFLRGDGTWAEAKQDLSAYYNNADYNNNKLQLKHDDKVLKEFEIKGSGGATITPKPTVNPQIKNDDKKVIITWEDPTDTVIEGSTFSAWAGTKLVMKESGYPKSPDDGTVLVDNTTRDKYKTTGFEKSGLTNDTVYYFALFPYSTDGVYNYDSGNRLLGEPTAVKIVTFADGTDEEIEAMIQAHYNDKINLSDYWAVGDTRNVALSSMSATGVGESHRAQTVQFVIGDFEHDDLATPINGHTKAAVTLLQKDCLMDATSASNVNNGSADTEKGYMNSTNTNVGGWKSCARRTWCNNVYFSALPSAWQSIVKTVNKKVSVGNNSSTIETVQDKIFLAAEIEIFGSTTYSVSGEGTQYQYYKNATANRYKMPKWNSSSVTHIYWERSPRSGNAPAFCSVYFTGSAYAYAASNASGVAPCLCI